MSSYFQIRNSNNVKSQAIQETRILETYIPNTKRQCTHSNTSYVPPYFRDAFNEDVSKQLEGKL